MQKEKQKKKSRVKHKRLRNLKPKVALLLPFSFYFMNLFVFLTHYCFKLTKKILQIGIFYGALIILVLYVCRYA